MKHHNSRSATVKVDIADLVDALVEAGVFDLAAKVRAEFQSDLLPPPYEETH